VINRDGDVNEIVGVNANDNLLGQALSGQFLRMGGSVASGRTDL
jgi:hypothetical protein